MICPIWWITNYRNGCFSKPQRGGRFIADTSPTSLSFVFGGRAQVRVIRNHMRVDCALPKKQKS